MDLRKSTINWLFTLNVIINFTAYGQLIENNSIAIQGEVKFLISKERNNELFTDKSIIFDFPFYYVELVKKGLVSIDTFDLKNVDLHNVLIEFINDNIISADNIFGTNQTAYRLLFFESVIDSIDFNEFYSPISKNELCLYRPKNCLNYPLVIDSNSLNIMMNFLNLGPISEVSTLVKYQFLKMDSDPYNYWFGNEYTKDKSKIFVSENIFFIKGIENYKIHLSSNKSIKKFQIHQIRDEFKLKRRKIKYGTIQLSPLNCTLQFL